MPVLTDEDKVIRNDVGKRIAAAIEELSAPDADKVSYDNTESGMTADNAQDAIDELKSDIDSVKLEDLDDVNLTSPQDEDELHYDSATSKWKNIAKKIYEKSASGSLVSFNDGGDNIPLKSLIANITAVQSGSGTPSPSNVRAISGFSAYNLSVTGANLWDEQWEVGGLDNSGLPTGATDRIRSKNYIPVRPNIKVYRKSPNNIQVFCYDNNKTFLSIVGWWTGEATLPDNCYFIKFQVDPVYGTTYNNNISINYPSTDTSYHAYTGTQITLPFGQTVYGGTLDVLSGVLTVTHKSIDMGSVEWGGADSNGLHNSYIVDMVVGGYDTDLSSFMCEMFTQKVQTVGWTNMSDGEFGIANISGSMALRVKWSNIASGPDFKTFVTGKKIVYELATPVIYKLTPEQVSTLLGLNNIFADTGDISLSYFTQNANAINDIAESNTRTALNTDVPKTDLTDIFVTGTKNNTGSTISAGTYFYVNNQLALCKSAISANADLTLNTNYELVTEGALNKLMSNINAIGTIELGTNASSVSVPDNSVTEMGSITLSAGVWIILACADWAKNANGYRQIAFGVGVDPVRQGAVTTLSAGENKETYQQIMQFSTFNAQTTQKVYVMQNSGSALNVFPYICAIRIA